MCCSMQAISLAKKKRVSLHDLANEPLILLDILPSRTYFTRLLESQGITPKISFASPSLELVRGLVGQGLGYSLLITRPHGDATYDGEQLAIRPIVEEVEDGVIAIAALKSLRPTRLISTFEEFCVNFFKQFIPREPNPHVTTPCDNHRRRHRRRFQRRIFAAGGLPRDDHRQAAAGRRLFLWQCWRHCLCRNRAGDPSPHPLKIPGWLMDPLGPLTIRWSYLPKALPWFLAAGRNAMPSRVRPSPKPAPDWRSGCGGF